MTSTTHPEIADSPPAAPNPPEPTPELLAEIAEASQRLERATPKEIIRWAVDRFFPKLTMATALALILFTSFLILSHTGISIAKVKVNKVAIFRRGAAH